MDTDEQIQVVHRHLETLSTSRLLCIKLNYVIHLGLEQSPGIF